MSQDINRCTLVGRLVRDVDLKSTNGGGLIAKFTLASNRSEKRGDTWSEAVGFFDCILFGKRAEALQKRTRKGSRICVDGNLRWSSWQGTDGKKASRVEINVTDFQFLDAKQESGSNSGAASFDSGAMSDQEDPPF
jgi:single-strand DNA-binding protein